MCATFTCNIESLLSNWFILVAFLQAELLCAKELKHVRNRRLFVQFVKEKGHSPETVLVVQDQIYLHSRCPPFPVQLPRECCKDSHEYIIRGDLLIVMKEEFHCKRILSNAQEMYREYVGTVPWCPPWLCCSAFSGSPQLKPTGQHWSIRQPWPWTQEQKFPPRMLYKLHPHSGQAHPHKASKIADTPSRAVSKLSNYFFTSKFEVPAFRNWIKLHQQLDRYQEKLGITWKLAISSVKRGCWD